METLKIILIVLGSIIVFTTLMILLIRYMIKKIKDRVINKVIKTTVGIGVDLSINKKILSQESGNIIKNATNQLL